MKNHSVFSIYFFFKSLTVYLITIFYQNIKVFLSSVYHFPKFYLKFNDKLKILNRLWKKNINYENKKEYIIMDGYDDSFLYLYTLISHTKKIEKIINLPVIVFDKNFSLIKKKIYNSFNLKNIIYINSLFFTLCVVFKKFKLIYNETNKIFSIKSCQDFSYTYEGIEISKIGYDDYLRFNMTGTVSDISGLKYFMFKSFLMSLKINEAISKKNINCFAGKETQFTPRGNLFQYCLKRSILAYIFFGPFSGSSIRKYKRFSHRSIPRPYINHRFYLYSLTKKNNFLKKSKDLLDKKFQGKFHKNEFVDAKYVFLNKNYQTKENLYKKLNFDLNKKLVVLYSHNVFDGVFENRRKLYIDFYIWMENTIHLLSKNKNINVLIKKHPTEFIHSKIEDITYRALKAAPQNEVSHIKMYPEDLNPMFVKDNADCIITARGSAGIDFGCYGIPSVTSCNTPYSYCGTTNEAKTVKEYRYLIENIHKIEKLDDNQIEKSLVLYYLINFLDKNDNAFFAETPTHAPKDFVGFQKDFEYRFLDKIFDKIKKIDDVENTTIYKKYYKFINSNNYTMFDTDKLL
jgi:hypothetical protein